MVRIVECPRDAMQGIREMIPTETKVRYINQLLKVGYHTLDFGSFVSPKAIPQMADTALVLDQLDLSSTDTKLLAIIANKRGARDACQFEQISFLGYPFSISETFQLRNTNATLNKSLKRVQEIMEIANQASKKVVIYLSMGFGNPYGDPWSVDIALKWMDVLSGLGIEIVQLSDTIGVANPRSIEYLFSQLIPKYPDMEIGAHFHTTPSTWEEKIRAAYDNGCRRFDSAMRGFGGCPMAKDELTGNMATENLLYFFDREGVELNLDNSEFLRSLTMASEVFPL